MTVSPARLGDHSRGVTKIEAEAFEGCTSLASVTIPKYTEVWPDTFPTTTVVEYRRPLTGAYSPTVNQRFLDTFQARAPQSPAESPGPLMDWTVE